MATGRITKTAVDGLRPGERDQYLWDDQLAGFGLKVTPKGAKVYVAQYRTGGRGSPTRRVTLGRHGTLTPEKARTAAGKVLANVTLGEDPAGTKAAKRAAGNISDLMERYFADHVQVRNKPSTAAEYRRLIDQRIKPALGHHRVADLSRSQVSEWHHGMRAIPYEANRALACLSKAMTLASTVWELRESNPCRGVQKFAESKRERFYSDDELKRIGAALAEAEEASTVPRSSAAAIRLLATTGLRVSEVLALQWNWLDLARGVLYLPDAKAGARTVALSAAAITILKGLDTESGFVLRGHDPEGPLGNALLWKHWLIVRSAAKVPDGRLHDFRHTAGTYAGQSGANAFLVRDLLGHKTLAMTGRYVERHVDPVRVVADQVGARVAAAMAGKPDNVVKIEPKTKAAG